MTPPTKVGPPPMMPEDREEPPRGPRSRGQRARRSRSPRSRCGGRSRSTRISANAVSPMAADWPIASPSDRLCRPSPIAVPSAMSWVDSPSARRRRTRLANQTSDSSPNAIESAKASEVDDEVGRSGRSPRGRLERSLDRLDGRREDVPDQEQDDAGSPGGQERLGPRRTGSAAGRPGARGRSWHRRSPRAGRPVRRSWSSSWARGTLRATCARRLGGRTIGSLPASVNRPCRMDSGDPDATRRGRLPGYPSG